MSQRTSMPLFIIVLCFVFISFLMPVKASPQNTDLPTTSLKRQVFNLTDGEKNFIGKVGIELSSVELRVWIQQPYQPLHVFRRLWDSKTTTAEIDGQTVFALTENQLFGGPMTASGNLPAVHQTFAQDMGLLRAVREFNPLTLQAEVTYPIITKDDQIFSSTPGGNLTSAVGHPIFVDPSVLPGENDPIPFDKLRDCYKQAQLNLEKCTNDKSVTDKSFCYSVHAAMIANCNNTLGHDTGGTK